MRLSRREQYTAALPMPVRLFIPKVNIHFLETLYLRVPRTRVVLFLRNIGYGQYDRFYN